MTATETRERALTNSGKTLAEVSKETGIAYTTLFDWKKGRTKELGFKKMRKVAAALGTSLEELVDGDD